ncbi:MAG TPA: VOC family protein [Acidimicrobiales bacterium]|nr:VOC family protein [Acidimicrobiales bacterium]
MNDTGFRFTGITPYLHYEDGAAMLDWLARVLGFQERSRFVDKDGRVMQAEMLVGDDDLWFSGHEPGYWDGRERPDQLTLVWVDDVDAHHAHVRAAGVAAPDPEDKSYGVRTYMVTDPEGYQWGFMTSLDTGYVQTIPTEEGGLREIRAAGA